jgi:hypothetical protein
VDAESIRPRCSGAPRGPRSGCARGQAAAACAQQPLRPEERHRCDSACQWWPPVQPARLSASGAQATTGRRARAVSMRHMRALRGSPSESVTERSSPCARKATPSAGGTPSKNSPTSAAVCAQRHARFRCHTWLARLAHERMQAVRTCRPAAARTSERCCLLSCSGRIVSSAHCGPVPGTSTAPAAAAAAPSPSATACLRRGGMTQSMSTLLLRSKHARRSLRTHQSAQYARRSGSTHALRLLHAPKRNAMAPTTSASASATARGCSPTVHSAAASSTCRASGLCSRVSAAVRSCGGSQANLAHAPGSRPPTAWSARATRCVPRPLSARWPRAA